MKKQKTNRAAKSPVTAIISQATGDSPSTPCTQSNSLDSCTDETTALRRGGKPFQPLPEFAGLSRQQLDYIHDLLRHKTYDDAQQEIWTSLGCRISISRLHRYREKVDLAAALEIAAEDTLPAVDQLNALLAGRETNIPSAGLQLIQQRALALAASPKTSPTLLKDLFRIFTYEDRKDEKERGHQLRVDQAAQLNLHRQQTTEDRRDMNAHRQQMDREKIRLAEEREKTRRQLADLAERKHADAQKIRVDNTPKHIDQTEMSNRVEAIIAYGREYLRQQAAAKQAAFNNSSTIQPSDNSPASDSTSPDTAKALNTVSPTTSINSLDSTHQMERTQMHS